MGKNIPVGWESIKLGLFVKSEKGKKPKRQGREKTEQFSMPYIDIEAFEKNIIKSWTDGEKCTLCSEEDFLMVWDGSRSGLVGKGMNGALGSTLVRINFPYLNNSYAYFFLKSKFLEINTRAKGTGTPHVDPDLLWNYELPIPPISEQRRIVEKIEELFSELEKGVENLKQAHKQLEIYRLSAMKDVFKGYPTESTVGALFDFIGGGTPSKKVSQYWGGNIPWASVKDIKGDYLNQTIDCITEAGLLNSAANMAKKDDVILVTRISPGKALVSNIESAINQDLKIVRPKFEAVPLYIHYLFESIQREVIKLSSGTTVQGINLTNLKSIPIPNLTFDEQKEVVIRIEEKFSVLDKLEQDIVENLKRAEVLRQAILKKAFSGQLVAQDPDDEPASVLLERIKQEELKDTQSKKRKVS